jgi:hypothetical protein
MYRIGTKILYLTQIHKVWNHLFLTDIYQYIIIVKDSIKFG